MTLQASSGESFPIQMENERKRFHGLRSPQKKAPRDGGALEKLAAINGGLRP
jgi:hypothetical protein